MEKKKYNPAVMGVVHHVHVSCTITILIWKILQYIVIWTSGFQSGGWCPLEPQKNLKYKLLSLLDTRVSDGTRSCEDLMVCACYQAAVLIKLACI